jgi:hypothetical protein
MSKAITIMCVVRINVNKCVFERRTKTVETESERKKLMSSSKNRSEHVFNSGRKKRREGRKLKKSHR